MKNADVIYKNFKDLEAASSHYAIVNFYESHQSDIDHLDFDAYFELAVSYTDALFEVGAYQKHLIQAEKLIRLSLEYSIRNYKGEDIYYKMLFKKAASYYNLLDIRQAVHILKELIRMNPENVVSVHFLKKCMQQKKPYYIHNTRAIAVFLFFITACVIALEILYIRSFYSDYAIAIEIIRTSLFLSGVGLLAGGEILHYWEIERRVRQFWKKAKWQKQSKQTVIENDRNCL